MDALVNNPEALRFLIEKTYEDRAENNYERSRPMRYVNS